MTRANDRSRTYFVTMDSAVVRVELRGDEVRVDGAPFAVDLVSMGADGGYSLLVDGASRHLAARRVAKGDWRVHLEGRSLAVEIRDERAVELERLTSHAAAEPEGMSLRAPMPGLVVRLEVGVGDRVEGGDGLVIIEAMKMENELRATAAGIVIAIHVDEGQAVEKNQILVEIGEGQPGPPDEGASERD